MSEPIGQSRAPAPARWDRAIVIAFHAAALSITATWLLVLPCDATDLSYLLSLEDHAWVTAEVVHPLWVPLLRVYRAALRGVGYHGFMLVPIEAANGLVSLGTALFVFHVGRRRTGSALAAAGAALLLMSTSGFGAAAVRPTPYAPAFACVLGALLLLAGARRASPRLALGAGAIGGIAMSLHASAMALAPAALLCAVVDPERRGWRGAIARAGAFGLGMILVFGASWAGWFTSNGLDRSFFEPAHLRALFGGVEQVPGTSIYSSHSAWSQIAGLGRTLLKQGFLLVPLGALAAFVEVRRARAPGATPADRRLLVAALACLGGFGGFFVINNNRNGFNYAALALLPLVFAQAAARAPRPRRALVATSILAVGAALGAALHAEHNRFHERLPQEIAFVESALGPGGVLLVPGCAFGELRLLSSLPVLRVRAAGDQATTCATPSAEAGEALRARVQGWRDHGRRVLFAYGDEAHDFSGDANGMEKDVQLFWSPELRAEQRAPKLRAARAALAAAGLRVEDAVVSPRGARYGDVIADAGGGPRALPPALPASTPAGWTGAVPPEVERFHALVPDDPWAPCDALCARPAEIEAGKPSAAEARSACGCPGPAGGGEGSGAARGPAADPGPPGCVFVHPGSADDVRAYVRAWTEHAGLDAPLDWSASLDRARAEVTMRLPGGTLRLAWHLLGSCEAAPVEIHADGPQVAARATPGAAQDFAARFPAPKARGN